MAPTELNDFTVKLKHFTHKLEPRSLDEDQGHNTMFVVLLLRSFRSFYLANIEVYFYRLNVHLLELRRIFLLNFFGKNL